MLLLGHLKSLKALVVNEVELSEDRLILGLSLERDVLDADEVELERVELLAVEFAQKCLFTANCKLEIIQRHCLQLVEAPLEREAVFREEKAGDVNANSFLQSLIECLTMHLINFNFEHGLGELNCNILCHFETNAIVLFNTVMLELNGAWPIICDFF